MGSGPKKGLIFLKKSKTYVAQPKGTSCFFAILALIILSQSSLLPNLEGIFTAMLK